LTTSIDVLFVDDSLVAVNKPAGLITIPDGYQPDRENLLDSLSNRFDKVLTIHRLDAETSGIVLFARTQAAHRKMNAQFEQRQIVKIYHLLVFGALQSESPVVTHPLKINGDRQHRTVVDSVHGKHARTDFFVQQRFSNSVSMLSAVPHTGYTHQIRAHAASLGLWLLADSVYLPHPFPAPEGWQQPNKKELFQLIADLPIQRTALHAYQISFAHPVTGAPITLEAPYPTDFSSTLAALSR
jgi:RluA family pseudouridine synthase